MIKNNSTLPYSSVINNQLKKKKEKRKASPTAKCFCFATFTFELLLLLFLEILKVVLSVDWLWDVTVLAVIEYLHGGEACSHRSTPRSAAPQPRRFECGRPPCRAETQAWTHQTFVSPPSSCAPLPEAERLLSAVSTGALARLVPPGRPGEAPLPGGFSPGTRRLVWAPQLRVLQPRTLS